MSNYIERYWRDAEPEDALRDPPLMARFKDHKKDRWTSARRELQGFSRGIGQWIDSDGDMWLCCQVYDVPDPGEGWRLIDPNQERLRIGDEFMLFFERQSGWVEIVSVPMGWSASHFYRRRIEQPKPEPVYEPYTWDDREQLIDREYRLRDNPKTWFKVTAVSDVGGTLIIDGYRSDYFMVKYQWLDGSVCGRLV